MLVTDQADSLSPGPLLTFSLPAGIPRRVGDIRATDAAWSPDGFEIAHISGEDFFRAIKDGSNGKLLAHLPGVGWRPRWSPDRAVLRLTIQDSLTAFLSLWEVRSPFASRLEPAVGGRRRSDCATAGSDLCQSR